MKDKRRKRRRDRKKKQLPLEELLNAGLDHHQRGELDRAEAFYREILFRAPEHAQALHLLGTLAFQSGQTEPAVELVKKAINADPQNPSYLSDAGAMLKSVGRLDEAARCFRQAITVRDDYAEAYVNLASTLAAQENFSEAKKAAQKAVQINPDLFQAYNNMGVAEEKLGNLENAIKHFEKALKISPDYAEALLNHGDTLRKLGKFDQALHSLEKAARLQPENPEVAVSLGVLLLDTGKAEKATEQFEQALKINPEMPEALNNLGLALNETGQTQKAIRAQEKAVELSPTSPDYLCNLGSVYREQGKLKKALECFQKASKNNPSYGKAYCYAGALLVNQGELEKGTPLLEKGIKVDPNQPSLHSNLLLSLCYVPDTEQEKLFQKHAEFGRLHEKPEKIKADFSIDPAPDRPLSIGYVSPDFRRHSVAYFTETILKNHDPENFRTICYSNVEKPDPTTESFKNLAGKWRDIKKLSDSDAEKCVREDRVDILVDLAGHTSGNRLVLFARKPAPVQITCIGYPATTGLESIDYRLTDEAVDPPGQDAFYTEKLLRLPGFFLCYTPEKNAPDVREKKPETPITFTSFNSLPKVNSRVIRVWAEILKKTPESRLVLKNLALRNPETTELVRKKFQHHGIAPERISLIGYLPKVKDHLEVYNETDAALDTFPYNGTTTTFEALWMGTPVVTLTGQNHAARVGTDILKRIGLDCLACETENEYICKAVELAGSLSRLREYRYSLRQKVSQALCDGKTYTRKLEAALRKVWKNFCDKHK